MRGSNNNFDFLRFFAASLVVFTHSFMFSPTGSATEPLSYISRDASIPAALLWLCFLSSAAF